MPVAQGSGGAGAQALEAALWSQWGFNSAKFCLVLGDVEAVLGGLEATVGDGVGGGREGASAGPTAADQFEAALQSLRLVLGGSERIMEGLLDLRCGLATSSDGSTSSTSSSARGGGGSSGGGSGSAIPVTKRNSCAGSRFLRIVAMLDAAEQELQLQEQIAAAVASPAVDVAQVQTWLTVLAARFVPSRTRLWYFVFLPCVDCVGSSRFLSACRATQCGGAHVAFAGPLLRTCVIVRFLLTARPFTDESFVRELSVIVAQP
jgi:hypothetical protein